MSPSEARILSSRMKRAALTSALGLMLLFAASVSHGASEGSAQQPSRTIDRTLVCTVPVHAGIRELKISANTGVRDQSEGSKWFQIPRVGLGTGEAISGGIAAVAAGSRATVVDTAPTVLTGVIYHRDLCRPSRARVQLSSRGLGGGPASQLGDRYECVAPKQLLVRVRGEFSDPTSLRPRSGSSIVVASGTLKRGYLTAQTLSGRRLVYGSVSDSGKVSLFFVGTCVRD
jgi:hypothetical protein